MSREFPSEKIIETVATPGDSFVVLADTVHHDKAEVEELVSEVKKEYDALVEKIGRLTKEGKISLDIKMIVIADEYS